MAEAIQFVVRGEDALRSPAATRGMGAAPAPALGRGKVMHSVRVRSERAGGGEVALSAVPGRDIVELHLANGPVLYLHAESARDLMLAQTEKKRTRGGKAAAESERIEIPATLAWRRLQQVDATRGATRGLGDVLLSMVNVIREPAANLAAREIVKRVDAQVEEGVYRLVAKELATPKAARVAAIDATDDKPVLVLIHGTFSTTKGTFDKLWVEHPDGVRQLFDYYGGVYALDHRTLGASPIENALTLARTLPKGKPVHLVTHSRGGLVAEVLARACATKKLAGAELRLFAGADYKTQRDALAELVKAAKGLRIERVLRVACPARGTLLASKRLDAYLSVLKWTLELASLPVAPQIVDFLMAVAQRRTEPDDIPGIEAMIPDRPLVQWLHSPIDRIAGELRVVAGDIAGDSVTSWVKTLLSDLFYRTDNDLVVQTSSMYGGTPRRDKATFVFDQGGRVSHFNYFSNELTARAVVEGLVSAEPAGFRQIGPLSWEGKYTAGERGMRAAAADPSKPAVFVLPGILGSNLKQDDERIWLAFRIVFGLTRLAYKPGGRDGVEPDGPVGMVYDDLVDYLSLTHEVIEFGFDWRKPIEQAGRELAKAVAQKLDERKKTLQPVRLLAHSMGGLVARAMQLEAPEVWRRMLAVKDSRVLMLGTPNGGSWAPMQVLSGDDTFGNMLVGFGAPFRQDEARGLMAAMPGFIQLQAGLLDDKLKLDDTASWKKLADKDAELVREYSRWHDEQLQMNDFRWGLPPQSVLDQAVALRKRLEAQARSTDLVPIPKSVLLVVGRSEFTPDGYDFDEDNGLVYRNAVQGGDGRVTLENALLPRVPTWALDCEHGKLPQMRDAFKAYLELLQSGDTTELRALEAAAATRGVGAAEPLRIRNRRSRAQALSRPPETEQDVLDAVDRSAREAAPPPTGAVLEISVTNGNLAFVRPALLVGHYRSETLTGTEWSMDQLIGGQMQDALAVGNYPSEPGTSHVFENPAKHRDDTQKLPRPAAVIVVGLGDEGQFRGSLLVETVRRGVIAAAQWAAARPENRPRFDLAATLIGSGGPEMSAGQAAQLVAQGVREANVALLKLRDKWPLVGHLQFVELYLDRATEALRALQAQASTSPALFRVEPRVRDGQGGLPSPLDAGYRGTRYDFLRASTRRGNGGKGDGEADDGARIEYALDTRRARTEVRTQQPQANLVRELVKDTTRASVVDQAIGPTLFRLLVPIDLQPYLGGTIEMQIEVDDGTGGIPWELIDAPAGGDSRPWAIRSKLLRKFRTQKFRERVVDATKDAGVLIIGEPKVDDPRYPRLPGARLEANKVYQRLTAKDALPAKRVKALIAPDDPDKTGPAFNEVTEALESGNWRVVHVSGHGDTPSGKRPSRGVVLSNNTFIGRAEIEALQPVPELVFVNCCHVGAIAPSALLNYSRPDFAAGVAQELINIGVRCVVAAGWAVDDDAAAAFADTFYERLLRGERFMDAVAHAREEAYSMGGNTWAAYQCYGDPEWTLSLGTGDAQRPSTPPGREFAAVNSPAALVLALETIATMCESWIPKPDMEKQRAKIRYLESAHGEAWGHHGRVAEAFARAWTQAEDRDNAIRWYLLARKAEDGGASNKAIEQLHNLRVRVAAEQAYAACEMRDPQRRSLLESAREEAEQATEKLEKLFREVGTMERADLCASANKRLAIILDLAGKDSAAAIQAARDYYAAAESIGAELPQGFYPAINVIGMEMATGSAGVPAARFNALRNRIDARMRDDPDFWGAVGEIELTVYEALNGGALAPKVDAVLADLKDLCTRWPAQWMWSSVRDQARFVLPRYGKRVPGAEKEAAERLLKTIEAYAAPAVAAAPAKAKAPAGAPAPRAVRRKKAAGGRKPRRRRARKG